MTFEWQQDHHFNSPAETEEFARMLSLWAKPGFAIVLSGDLGAGKSIFARAFIKALAPEGDDFDVPSPTFSLVQIYDTTRVPVAHIDLYRLNKVEDVEAIGLSDLVTTHLVLIEWPELVMNTLDAPKLKLHFSGAGDIRDVKVSAEGAWARALERNATVQRFLRTAKLQNTSRKFLEGDASSRRYETLDTAGEKTILMDMPQRPDGPIVKNAKTYSSLVHLAERISSVIAVNAHLHQLGYSVPETFAVDLKSGLAVIEYLEGELHGQMMQRDPDLVLPMRSAVDVLANMAGRRWPATVPVNETLDHTIPLFDLEAQLTEVDLMPIWFWPYQNNVSAPLSARQSFASVWTPLIRAAIPKNPIWMLRDFHSPNLIWMPHRKGLKRTGLIDTQDAVLGNPAYDLVSLLQDARVDVTAKNEGSLYSYYVSLRLPDVSFDEDALSRDYAVLGAQRASRLLGTFTRLSKRDGKHAYLKHLPRVSDYLARNLRHPFLKPLKDWYDIHLPEALKLGEP